MSLDSWEHFFKPEVRASGRTFIVKGKVSASSPSDTEVIAFIRLTPPVKVVLKSESVEDATVLASCPCPAGEKGNFCKHIWSALLTTQDKFPDFLEGKSILEVGASFVRPLKNSASEKSQTSAKNQAFVEKRQAFKEKQTAYRKEQYQKQKQRLKDLKAKKQGQASGKPAVPANVEAALAYFEENGIELRDALNAETITASKKKLARVFHPDVGGSHEEILVLNNQAEILWKWIHRQG